MNRIVLPTERFRPHGYFTYELVRDGKVIAKQRSPNIVVNVGLNHNLDAQFGHEAPKTAWFIGIYQNNYAPVAGDTMTSLQAAITETGATELSQTVRPTYTTVAAASQQITNAAAKAAFDFDNAAGLTIFGAFMVGGAASTEDTFGGSTGLLMAASLFGVSRVVNTNDQLLVTYNITAADA